MKAGLMVVLLVSVFFICFSANNLYGQTIGSFQSAASGNWSNPSTWVTWEGYAWNPATRTPSAGDIIRIVAPHVVSVDVNVSVDTLIIDTLSSLVVNSDAALTVIANAQTGSGRISAAVHSVTVNGTYTHAVNGGTIPSANWGIGSTCLITGSTTIAPSNANQNFYNFIWNCRNQSANLNVGWNNNIIDGDVNVLNTGSKGSTLWWLRLTSSINGFGTVTPNIITINGDVNINGDSTAFTISGSAGINHTVIVQVKGNFTQTPWISASDTATFQLANGSGCQANWWMYGDVSLLGKSVGSNSTAGILADTLVFCGSGVQKFTNRLKNKNLTNWKIVVRPNSTLSMDTCTLGSSISTVFSLPAGASFMCSHPNGLNGNLTIPTAPALSKEANYVFTGSAPQVTGTLLPDTVNNLTINNIYGVTLSDSVLVNGTLTLDSTLTTGTNILAIGASGSVIRHSGYVIGNFQKYIATGATSKLFEIGDAASYAPVSVNFANVASAGNLTVSTTYGRHPAYYTSGFDSTKMLNRYYTLTNNGIIFDNYTATLNFNPADVIGGADPAQYIVKKYDSGTWTKPTTANSLVTSIQATGNTSFSDFAVGEPSIVIPMYTITLNANPSTGGYASTRGGEVFDSAAVVEVTAFPAVGYYFTGWSGDLSGTANPEYIVMNAQKNITANFSIKTYTLAMNATHGSVTQVPNLVSYDTASTVQLTASAAEGYHFIGWSGDLVGIANPINITMDANKYITAIFVENNATTFTLAINSSHGSVVRNPDQAVYDTGSVVQLTAIASGDYRFIDWSGDLIGTSNPINITMDTNKIITANYINTFTLNTYSENGTVLQNPTQERYDSASVVQLTASPALGYVFSGWSGDLQGANNPAVVTFDSHKSITAHFAFVAYTLTVATQGNGTVLKSPDQALYDSASTVQLTAVADSGNYFTGWSGDINNSNNPVNVVMNAFKTITANFSTIAPQTTGDFLSGASGNWSSPSTWLKWNGSSWDASTSIPSTGSSIHILAPHIVHVDINIGVDSLVVDTMSTLIIDSGITLTLVSGSITAAVNTIRVYGTYEHGTNGGSIPFSTWESGSTCLISGVTTIAPANASQNYYNFIWNCRNQISSLNLAWNNNIIGGNVNVLNTGAKGSTLWWLRLTSNIYGLGTVTPNIITINGNVNVNGDSTAFTISGSSGVTHTVIVKVNGNLTQTSWISASDTASFNIAVGSACQGNWWVQGDVSLSGKAVGTNSTAGILADTLVFCGTGVQKFTNRLKNKSLTNWKIVVRPYSTVWMDSSIIGSATGTAFILPAGASFMCSHPSGLNGNLTIPTAPVLSKGANYIFNGMTPQATGSLLPDTVNNLTINNISGVTLSDSVLVNGTLTLDSTLTTGTNVLAIGASGSVIRNSGHVVGNFQKYIATGATSKLFEIGDAMSYTPVSINFANVASAGNLTVSTTYGRHPAYYSSGLDSTRMLNRFYTLTNNGVGFNRYSATFNFNPADVLGGANTEQFLVKKYDSGIWTMPSTVNPLATSIEVTGVTSFSDFAIGRIGGIPVPAYTLTVTTDPISIGSVVKYPDQTLYDSASIVQLTAIPVSGYVFSHWSGDISDTTKTILLNMNGNKIITAHFRTVPSYTLTVNGTNGYVVKNPNQSSYDSASVVELVPMAMDGYSFSSWSGDLSGTSNPGYLIIDKDKNVTANYEPNIFTLSVSAANGTVQKWPDQPLYCRGARVELLATPASGYHFIGWSGDVTDTSYITYITLDTNKNVTANFAIDQYTLNVLSTIGGSAIKTPDQLSYDSASVVQLTATPAPGYYFLRWTGDLTSTLNPTSVIMAANKNITARFGYSVKVLGHTPTQNAFGVSNVTPIRVTFNAQLDSATCTNNTIHVVGSFSGFHPSNLNYDLETQSITIIPNVPFKPGENVNVILTRKIVSMFGDSLANPYSWNFTVGVNGGTGNYMVSSSASTGSGPWMTAAADFDGDGDIDLATANNSSNSISILRNTGNGAFVTSSTIYGGTNPGSIVSADFDNDGDIDLAVTSAPNVVTILKNNGSGIFSLSSTINAGNYPWDLTTLDVDGDGDIDLASANFSSNNVAILKNSGNGTFSVSSSIAAGTHPYSITAAEFNGDGYPDLAVANNYSNDVTILKNDGMGNFTSGSPVSVGSGPLVVTSFDGNKDGIVDLAITNSSSNTLSILKNNGSGVFAQDTVYNTGNLPISVIPIDVDGNGYVDLAMSIGRDHNVLILRNNGSGHLSPDTSVFIGAGNDPRLLLAADIDGNGTPEIISTNMNSNSLSILASATLVSVPVETGWNLVSMPLFQSIISPTENFSSKFGDLFRYTGGMYSEARNLTVGEGYWAYYTSAQNENISGLLQSSIMVSVHRGWNLIGSREKSVATSALMTNPSGQISGDVISYNASLGGYVPVTVLTAGQGYWIYINTDCVLTIP